LKKGASLVVSLILFCSAVLPYFLLHIKPAYGNQRAVMRPSRWPVFVGTSGDIEVNVTVPGFAVKIEIPWEFVPISRENDTSFVWSTITEDYWYYNVTDMRQHFPYDPNAPWYVIIWSWNLTWFTAPQIVRFKDMVAPSLAGLYNVTIYVSTSLALSPTRKPIFPTRPTENMTILVCRSRDWASVRGYIVDPEVPPSGIVVKAKGVVYAFNVETREREARALVNATTGFFNLTGLRPGRYFFEACAGYFPTTGFAYAVTNQSQWYPNPIPLSWRQNLTMTMYVDRGARISGSIKYQRPGIPGDIRSLSDHPWLVSLPYIAILNWVVEVRDTNGKLIAMENGTTLDQPGGDFFLIRVGTGRKYVGADPIATEFCGIGLGTYNLTAYVFAYVQKDPITPLIQIIQKGQDASRDIYLKTGAVISGSIRFVQSGIPLVVLESPRQAELRVCGTTSGAIFGGHVLVEAYRISDWSLNGIFVRNGTLRSGVTIYADQNTIRFYILGFTEFYNRTWSGNWRMRDYGLDGGVYNVKVHIRGYIQTTNENVTLALGSNQTLTVNLAAGGAIKTTLVSGIAWPCTMRIQMAANWLFIGGPVHYRARIYYYDVNQFSYGYTERIIARGQPNVTDTTLTTVFGGMNYDLAEVIYWGEVPTVLWPSIYNLKAFTYGYLQSTWPSLNVQYYCSSARIDMLIGCGINATGVLMRAGVFYRLVENVSYRADLFDGAGSLVGGQIGNATVGGTSIAFTCRGFGGWGHFFFVTPDGERHFDYGFGKGNFTLSVRRFGYLYKFAQTNFPTFTLQCLASEAGYIQRVYLLNRLYGVVYGLSDGLRRRVSWATVRVSDFMEVTTTLDGDYWVFMPDGRSGVQFSLVGYADQGTGFIVASGGADIQLPPIELIPV